MSDNEDDMGPEEVEEEEKSTAGKKKATGFPLPKDKPRFEVKKWQAVVLWSWDIHIENCAICKERIQELSNQIGETCKECTVAWGACNVFDCDVSCSLYSMHSIFTASPVGYAKEMCVLSTWEFQKYGH